MMDNRNRTSQPTATDDLMDMLRRMCGLDDMARTFMEKHNGGKPGCGCPFCESASAEWIADDLQALLWMLEKVACTIDSGIPRGGSEPSDN